MNCTSASVSISTETYSRKKIIILNSHMLKNGAGKI